MRIGHCAAYLDAAHVVAGIGLFSHGTGANRLNKAGPTAARLILITRAKQRLTADNINIQTRLKQLIVTVTKGTFGAIILCDLILLTAQALLQGFAVWLFKAGGI